MSDKYLNIDLYDSRTEAIAEVMTNKTCKKILDMLAEGEMSESEIASAMNIPLNTVGYNIKKLLSAGLIEKTKDVFWSVKGKRIPRYKLANKKIIISPKRMVPAAIPAMVIGAVLIGLLLIALIVQEQRVEQEYKGSESAESLKLFTSYEEMRNYIKERTKSYSYGYDSGGLVKAIAPTAPTQAASARGDAAIESSERASDYSETNVQVEGVDEPDIVKNDGKYIYTLSGNKVTIVDAFPASEMKVVSEINVSGASNIFVRGDELIILGTSYSFTYYEKSTSNEKISAEGSAELSIAPCYEGRGCGGYSTSKTIIEVYDISNKENPSLKRNATVSGSYVDARMIEEQLYVISSEHIYNDLVILPTYSIDGIETKIEASTILYPEIYDEQFTFTSILALDLEDGDIETKTYLTGGTSAIYVSEENIYLTSIKRMPIGEYNERMIAEVILPLLPNEEYSKIEEVMKSNKQDYEKRNAVWQIVQDYSQNLTGEEKNIFDSALQKKMQEFYIKIQKENEKTVIHKINIDDGEINYEGVGEVLGRVLNQFSMDEFDGYFRIATTTGDSWSGDSLNHLFVLDKELRLIGAIEDLAPGEKIYSVRFMGGRAYVVTFKKIDPFYVIDLSEASAPKVLGYLKIPGYSDYLHPYSENYIIGLGKNARGGNEQFAWYQGLKLSLFDVSDTSNPREVATIEIGDRGTDSYALYEHKAFLFDRERNLLVIPVQLAKINWTEQEKNRRFYQNEDDWRNSAYGERIWQGAYVFHINEEEIRLRGEISHYDRESNLQNGYEQQWFYDERYQVKRSLFMDDVLYTISGSKIKAHGLANLEEINKVASPYQQDYYGFGYGTETGIAV